MRIAVAFGLMLGTIALLPEDAAAQLAEKKVLTLEIARKMVASGRIGGCTQSFGRRRRRSR
jgi:hypothetical protein